MITWSFKKPFKCLGRAGPKHLKHFLTEYNTLSICLISQFVYAAGSDSSSGDSTPKYFTDAKKLVKRAGKLEKKEKVEKDTVKKEKSKNSKTFKKGYTVSTNQRMLMIATKELSLITTDIVSGIVAIQSANKLNMKSRLAMVVNSETTINSTAGTIYTIMSGGGTPTSTNKVDINPI